MEQPLPSLESSPPETLLNGYRSLIRGYDEMVMPSGRVREHWRGFLQGLEQFGPRGLEQHFARIRRLLREQGISHSIAGTPQDPGTRWELDPIPWFLSKDQWSELSVGLVQRARLLNRILADLYGPQELLRRGLIPVELVFAHPSFLLPCQGIVPPQGIHLHLTAAQLVRGSDGRWMVLADRTQGPSGAGFAVENRIVLSRTLPDDFHGLRVERLASFFLTLRETLHSLAPHQRDNPRVVLLSPGPRSPTYFEDTYLARYLGYILAEGGDLTVRGTSVYLKTLGGLLPVDVILRRMSDEDGDPLELKGSSLSGVPGLVQATRSRQVVVANTLGSGILEMPATAAFLPDICRHLLGEELLLPSLPTWWCGRDSDWQEVQARFSDLMIRPALASSKHAPIFTADLAAADRQELLNTIRRHRQDFVAHPRVTPSTGPVWSDGRLRPEPVGLRAFVAAASDGSYQAMPGGLARICPQAKLLDDMATTSHTSKDAWVLSDRPVQPVTLLRPQAGAVEIRRSGNDLPSRVADNLYWLGRLFERSEGVGRHLRSCVVRMTSDMAPSAPAEVATLLQTAAENIPLPPPDPDPAVVLESLQQLVLSLVFQPAQGESLLDSLRSMYRTASVVRDRLSVDMWRIVNQLDLNVIHPWSRERASLGDVLLLLNQVLNLLSALNGLGMESMTRGPGWRFLDMGRRLERALHTIRLLRGTLVKRHADLTPMLEAVLEIADSSMTYRYRYLTSLQLAPVLDLVLIDETNPRSVGFQVTALADHVRELPSKGQDPLRNQETRIVLGAQTSLRLADVDALTEADDEGTLEQLDSFLEQLSFQLMRLSESITHTYLSHTGPSRPLGSNPAVGLA